MKIVTWNLEWLGDDDGSGLVPRYPEDYAALASYAARLDADIIAVQEVDGSEAVARVFDPEVYDIHLAKGGGAQRGGFVFRKAIGAVVLPDLTELGADNLRSGADLAVELGGQTIRLLGVHLKSGCFTGAPTGSSTCRKLAQQMVSLEGWIDARAAEGMPFVVLGDFNRRFFARANEPLWAGLDDGDPANLDLSSSTQERSPGCNGERYSDFVDHIIIDARTSAFVEPGSFEELVYELEDTERFALSDHCPLSIELGSNDDESTDPFSCEDGCGETAPGGCSCDEACESHGNCCDDEADACG